MTVETWLLFVLTEGALCLTPGPAVLLVLSQGLTRGTSASVSANLGILAGNACYFTLSATGLGAILMASYDLFSLIRWIGAGYLVWLGVMAFIGKSSVIAVAPVAAAPTSSWRTFGNGLVLQVSNPKALVFFTALVLILLANLYVLRSTGRGLAWHYAGLLVLLAAATGGGGCGGEPGFDLLLPLDAKFDFPPYVPPDAPAITGLPHACASSSTMPNPSMSQPTCRLGSTNRSHC